MSREGVEQLLLGSLQLARGPASDTETAAYEMYALADDATFGNPVPITTVIDSLLGDGQLVSIDRHGNREARFGIRVNATNGALLNAAEAALVAETEKPNTLTWVGPDGYTPTTVFDVVTSWAEQVMNSDDEVRTSRKFVLNLTLYPHPRSAQSTTVPALGSGIDPVDPPVRTVINTCSSLSGWSARAPLAGKVDALALGTTPTYIYQRADIGFDLYLKLDTGAVQDWTATPFVQLDWKPSETHDPAWPVGLYISGPSLAERGIAKISEGPSPLAPGWLRTTWQIPTENLTQVRYLKFNKPNELTTPTDGRWAFLATEVAVTNGGAANDGTSRQLSRSLSIGGTARAMGIIDIKHTSALGDTLIWSGPPACAVPALRRRRVDGAGELGDTSMVSGAYEDIGVTEWAAHVPLRAVPAGAYLVMARLLATDSNGEHDVEVRAQTRIDTSDTTQVAVGPVFTINATADLSTSTYRILPLGVMHLPPAEVAAGSDGVVRVVLSGVGVRLDEAWIFNITDGSLTFVSSADKVLRITSPTLEDPRRRVWTGPSDLALYDAGSKAAMRDEHLFTPGEWAAFTVTTGAQNAAVTVTYDKRWHSNAGEDG